MIYNIGDEVRITWNEELFKDEIGVITYIRQHSMGNTYFISFKSGRRWTELYHGELFKLSGMTEDELTCGCSSDNIKLYNKAKRTYIPTKKRFGIVAFTKEYYK